MKLSNVNIWVGKKVKLTLFNDKKYTGKLIYTGSNTFEVSLQHNGGNTSGFLDHNDIKEITGWEDTKEYKDIEKKKENLKYIENKLNKNQDALIKVFCQRQQRYYTGRLFIRPYPCNQKYVLVDEHNDDNVLFAFKVEDIHGCSIIKDRESLKKSKKLEATKKTLDNSISCKFEGTTKTGTKLTGVLIKDGYHYRATNKDSGESWRFQYYDLVDFDIKKEIIEFPETLMYEKKENESFEDLWNYTQEKLGNNHKISIFSSSNLCCIFVYKDGDITNSNLLRSKLTGELIVKSRKEFNKILKLHPNYKLKEKIEKDYPMDKLKEALLDGVGCEFKGTTKRGTNLTGILSHIDNNLFSAFTGSGASWSFEYDDLATFSFTKEADSIPKEQKINKNNPMICFSTPLNRWNKEKQQFIHPTMYNLNHSLYFNKMEKKKMNQITDCTECEEMSEAKYELKVPGANKENTSIKSDSECRKIVVTTKDETLKLDCSAEITIPKRYDLDKTNVSIKDGIITILIPTHDGVVKTIEVK